MAVYPVGLCPDLLPWRNAGLNWLYFPEAFEPRALLGAAPLRAAPRAVSALREKATPVPPAQAPGPSLQPPPDSPEGEMESFLFTEETLPEPWKKILSLLSPAPLIWTYAELGWDLLVQGDARRRETLQKLLLGLRLRRGSSAFLPLKTPKAAPEDAAGERAIFCWFLERLGGKIVILLGKEALEQGPYAGLDLGYFRETLSGGRVILSLPGLNELAEDEARLEATLAYMNASSIIAQQRIPPS